MSILRSHRFEQGIVGPAQLSHLSIVFFDKPYGTGPSLVFEGATSSPKFIAKGLFERKIEAFIGREPIAPHTDFGKGEDVFGEPNGLVERVPVGDDAVDGPHRERFLRADRAAREDEIERPTETDDPREPDRAAIDEWHTETATKDAERGALFGDAEIGKEGQRARACNGISRDVGTQRL